MPTMKASDRPDQPRAQLGQMLDQRGRAVVDVVGRAHASPSGGSSSACLRLRRRLRPGAGLRLARAFGSRRLRARRLPSAAPRGGRFVRASAGLRPSTRRSRGLAVASRLGAPALLLGSCAFSDRAARRFSPCRLPLVEAVGRLLQLVEPELLAEVMRLQVCWRLLHAALVRGILHRPLELARHRADLAGEPAQRRNMPGRSFGPTTISATTPMSRSSLQPMSNMVFTPRARDSDLVLRSRLGRHVARATSAVAVARSRFVPSSTPFLKAVMPLPTSPMSERDLAAPEQHQHDDGDEQKAGKADVVQHGCLSRENSAGSSGLSTPSARPAEGRARPRRLPGPAQILRRCLSTDRFMSVGDSIPPTDTLGQEPRHDAAADRLFALIRILRDGRLHRGRELATRLGVSLRTALPRHGHAHRARACRSRASGAWATWMTAPITLPPLNLTLDELEALHLGLAGRGRGRRPEAARGRPDPRRQGRRRPARGPRRDRPPGRGFALYPFADAARGFATCRAPARRHPLAPEARASTTRGQATRDPPAPSAPTGILGPRLDRSPPGTRRTRASRSSASTG